VINSKYFSGLTVALLIFAAVVFAVLHWGLPGLLQAGEEKSVNSPIKPIVGAEQSVPEEFIEFDSRLGAGAEHVNKSFAAMATQDLWQALLTGFHSGKSTQIGLENALIARLRQEPDSTIYNELLAQFRPGILDANAQQVLVSLLGEVGNYKAADALMRLVNGGLVRDSDVKFTTFHAISKFAPESWRDHPNTELAPVFEAAWQTQDTEYLAAIANVMASIGTPTTLDIFLQALTENNDNERVGIVRQAMTILVNPALIPKLADSLYKSPVENVQLASGDALASMGDPVAADKVIDWFAQADASKVEQVREWSKIIFSTTPEIVDDLEKSLAGKTFKAEANKQAFLDEAGIVKSGTE
jgi:hypothetical protein